MFKNVPLEKCYRLIGHGPCVLITSGKGEKINVAPVAWTMPVNDEPPLVAISVAETHYTTELIQKTGEFVINVPGAGLLPKLMAAGSVSGRKGDKFGKIGLTPKKSSKVSAPYIEECIGRLECRVKKALRFNGVVVFVARVLAAKVKEGLFNEYWNCRKAKTIHHLGGSSFMVSEKTVQPDRAK